MEEGERLQIRDARKQYFFMIDNVMVDHYAAIIGPFATLTYTALCRHADRSTRETHPSHTFLAKELAISTASVKRGISKLIEHGLIERKHRKSKSGDPDTNIYIILEPWGRFPQTLPINPLTGEERQELTKVGSVGTEVGSVGTEGRVSQNPGVGSVGTEVGSVGATNNTQLQDSVEQDSLNKIPPENANAFSSPAAANAAADTSGGTPDTPILPKKPRKPRTLKERPTHDPEGYDRFIAEYPLHTNLDEAIKAWDWLKPDIDLQAVILADICARKAGHQKWADGYIPHPSTYIRGRRWRDDIIPLQAPRASPRRDFTQLDHSPEAEARRLAKAEAIMRGED